MFLNSLVRAFIALNVYWLLKTHAKHWTYRPTLNSACTFKERKQHLLMSTEHEIYSVDKC